MKEAPTLAIEDELKATGARVVVGLDDAGLAEVRRAPVVDRRLRDRAGHERVDHQVFELGLEAHEQLLDSDGHQMAVWMERSYRPHDLALVRGPNGGLHHFAYWLDDWDHVRRSADILAYNGISIDVGPTRHGITRCNTIYFYDPLGTRNEVFTGGYRPDPDFPTITWTEDNIGRAVFYYEGEVNSRFMTEHT